MTIIATFPAGDRRTDGTTYVAPTERRYGSVAIIFAAIPATIPLVAAFSQMSFTSAAIWAAMIACICFPAWKYATIRQNAYDPYSFLIFNAFQLYMVPAFYFLAFHVATTPAAYYNRALIVVGLAFAFTSLGYLLDIGRFIGKKLPLVYFSNATVVRIGRLMPMAVLIYALGWGARLRRASGGYSHGMQEVDASYQLLGIFADAITLSTLAYIVILYYLVSRRPTRIFNYVLAGVLVLIEMAGGALLGSRSGPFFPLIGAGLALTCAGRRIRLLWLAVAYLVVLPHYRTVDDGVPLELLLRA